ncbi:hypothetical protein CXF95_26880 [Paraglaciecola sp. MB-3u-78]|jgi:serine O-acetyltransferase|nr:hypothetical protein CXF95_26880 [Paraglaciecola sp. MB-3u-78]
MFPSPRLTFSEVKRRICWDHRRLLNMLNEKGIRNRKSAYFHPSFHAVLFYRLANYFQARGSSWLGRMIWHFNLLWTGADISEHADIGEGFVVLHPAGVAVMGSAGKNLTVSACSGLGGETGRFEDIGAGPGFCLIGDNVILEPHSGVLGPVTVGNNVIISAVVAVTFDVPDNTTVEAHEYRAISNAK